MIVIRLVASVAIPPIALSFPLLLGKFIGKFFSSAGNAIEGVFGLLLFWPLAVYERVVVDPSTSETFWNAAMGPCAIAVLSAYVVITFISLGRFKIFQANNKS